MNLKCSGLRFKYLLYLQNLKLQSFTLIRLKVSTRLTVCKIIGTIKLASAYTLVTVLIYSLLEYCLWTLKKMSHNGYNTVLYNITSINVNNY